MSSRPNRVRTTSNDINEYIGDRNEFRAMLREKELAQQRFLQEQMELQQQEAQELSIAEIESVAQSVNITSKPAIEHPKLVWLER